MNQLLAESCYFCKLKRAKSERTHYSDMEQAPRDVELLQPRGVERHKAYVQGELDKDLEHHRKIIFQH